MAHQPPNYVSASTSIASLVIFPHEQYPKRRAYKAASAIARKKRRSKLNDHRRHAYLLCNNKKDHNHNNAILLPPPNLDNRHYRRNHSNSNNSNRTVVVMVEDVNEERSDHATTSSTSSATIMMMPTTMTTTTLTTIGTTTTTRTLQQQQQRQQPTFLWNQQYQQRLRRSTSGEDETTSRFFLKTSSSIEVEESSLLPKNHGVAKPCGQQQQQQQQPRHDAESTTTGSNTSKTIMKNRWIIRPDPRGIRTAVALIRKGQALAIPTECTYEMIMRMSVLENKGEQHHQRAMADPDKDDNQTPEEVDEMTNTFIPTAQLPHIYISPDVKRLETSRFWNNKRYIPTRSYGIQNKQDGTTIICRFNEAVVVLKAIAPCIWPGPCCVYFPIASPLILAYRIRASVGRPMCNNSVVDTDHHDQQQKQPPLLQHYVKFRSPRHPLAIRMCHELGYAQRRPPRALSTLNGDSGGITLPTPTIHEPKLEEDEDEHVEDDHTSSRTKSNASDVGNSSCCNSMKGGSSTVSSSGLNNHRCVLLIGYPLKHEKNKTSSGTGGELVTRSRDVPSCMHVLDGEDETYELLRVPTCRETSSSDDCWMVLDVSCRTIFIGPEVASKPLVKALQAAPDASTSLPVQSAVLRKWKVECRDEPFLPA